MRSSHMPTSTPSATPTSTGTDVRQRFTQNNCGAVTLPASIAQ